MEYIGGFIIAFVLMYFLSNLNIKNNIFQEPAITPLRYSQSHIHSLVSDMIPPEKKKPRKRNTQSRVHDQKNSIKVIIMDNNAYWIRENAFYTADMQIDGTINKDTTRRVDTGSMNKVQLDKMLFIIDQLKKEEDDDSRSSGY